MTGADQTPPDLTELRASVREAPRLMTYLKVQKALASRPARPRKVAVISSFTVRPLDPYLRVEAELSGWRVDPVFTEYSLWQQALLEPDESAEAVMLLLHADELLGAGAAPEAAAETASDLLLSVLAGFRSRSSAPIVIARFPTPVWARAAAFGSGASAARAVRTLNGAIERFVADNPLAYAIELPPMAANGRAAVDTEGLVRSISPIAAAAAPSVAERIARALSGFFRPRRKLLITDLDNTLWPGVVGEAGSDGIALAGEWPGEAHRQLQRAMRELASSGILLAINSKNNEADARAVFDRPDMVLRWDDFAARRINWTDKAENIADMARELSLGVDSFVFLDDSPIECARVRSAFPEIEVVQLPAEPDQFIDALLDCRGFDTLSVTSEDRLRAEGVKAERQRVAVAATAGDLTGFLSSLDLRIEIRPCDDEVIERVHQLLNKTNQFHLTLERPGLATLAERRSGLRAVTLKDRFGDYGAIGALEVDRAGDEFRLRNLAVSCRALGRRVEETALAFAVEQARQAGATVLSTCLVRGPRNAPAWEFVERSGFSRDSHGDETQGQRFCMDVAGAAPGYPAEVSVVRSDGESALANIGS